MALSAFRGFLLLSRLVEPFPEGQESAPLRASLDLATTRCETQARQHHLSEPQFPPLRGDEQYYLHSYGYCEKKMR